MFRLKLFLFYAILLLFKNQKTEGSCLGCVELDEYTFDKLVRKFDYSLIKFDIAFPYGEKHQAFSEFSKLITPKIDELLIALIGVKDYGEKENLALTKRFKIDENKFPVILLFKNFSSENWIKYPNETEINTQNLKEFVKKNSNLYINLDGCLEALDVVAEGFVDKSLEDKEKIIKIAEEISKKYENDDTEKSKIYLTVMKKIKEKGKQFIDEETNRIKNILKGKIRDIKKLELRHRLNIMQSFKSRSKGNAKKEEL